MAIATVNPATGALVQSYQPYDEDRRSAVLDAAQLAQRVWAAEDMTARTQRFLVDDAVYDDFVDATTTAMDELKVGDPFDPETQLSPMARRDLRDELHDQVEGTVTGGARVACGGTVPTGPGAYYPATLLVDTGPGMVGFDEELFGPAGVVARAKSEAALVRLANASRYGLGASVWSSDPERARRIGERLQSGMVLVNDFVRSDPRIPFGGVKASGYGRELGPDGIREFVNVQTVYAR